MAPRITVVNHNAEFLELLRDLLTDERYVTTCIDADVEDELARIVESRPDLLIIDLRLGTDEYHGWDIAQQIRREPKLDGLPVLICSTDVLALQSMADDLAGVRRVRTLAKPFAITELTAAIDHLLAEAAAG
jgi:DNA-binding response OmpR family regulator